MGINTCFYFIYRDTCRQLSCFFSFFFPTREKVLKRRIQKSKCPWSHPEKCWWCFNSGFAILLIICTIIVQQQIRRNAQDRAIGYNKDNLIYHFLTGDINKNYALIKNELISSGAASAVTKTSAPLTQAWSDSWGFEWERKRSE